MQLNTFAITVRMDRVRLVLFLTVLSILCSTKRNAICTSVTLKVASFPGAEEGEEKATGTHCLCMRLIATECRGNRVCTRTYTGDVINSPRSVPVGVLLE